MTYSAKIAYKPFKHPLIAANLALINKEYEDKKK